jgi:hypothetical protein
MAFLHSGPSALALLGHVALASFRSDQLQVWARHAPDLLTAARLFLEAAKLLLEAQEWWGKRSRPPR